MARVLPKLVNKNNLFTAQDRQGREIAMLKRGAVRTPNLEAISPELGEYKFLREDGSVAVRIGSFPEEDADTGTFTNLNGRDLNGALQWGIDSDNGEIIAANKSVRLNKKGIALSNGATIFNAEGVMMDTQTVKGFSWEKLGAALNAGGLPIYFTVYALGVDRVNDILYAGGTFTSAGGSAISYFAKWQNGTWSRCGTIDPNGQVRCVHVDRNGNVYIGGSFTQVDGVSCSKIAKWNGTVWSALGTGVDDTVYGIATDSGGNVYAAGSFNNAGGSPIRIIAKWNGSAWSSLGSVFPLAYGAIHAVVCDASNNIYVTNDANNYLGGVSKWNGSAWSLVGTMDGRELLCIDANNNLYTIAFDAVVDSPDTIYKWNGSVWEMIGTDSFDDNIRALAVDMNGIVYAGGDFLNVGTEPMKYFARWDGSEWSNAGASPDARVTALAIDPFTAGNLYVGGSFTSFAAETVGYLIKLCEVDADIKRAQVFGVGSDGDWKVTGVITLKRDMYFRNLWLAGASARVKLNGYKLFVSGILKIDNASGSVDADGENGVNGGSYSGGDGGSAGTRPYTASPHFSFPLAGGNGGTPAGAGTANSSGGTTPGKPYTAMSPYTFRPGQSGAGGGCHGVSPAVGGSPATQLDYAGAGGNGGTATGTANNAMGGGGGGSGGGVVWVYAYCIDNAGRISAKGGNGGSGGTGGGNKGGNGGGGGGGTVVIYFSTIDGAGIGTVSASGGAAGTAGNGGSAGSAGSTYVYQL
jgi:hypothetical protein